jgi:hypothetical protein
MRQGQQNNNKRMRGRNRKGPNPLTRSYESNGPDVKVRGTALHIAEKYVQLARDAQSSGDRVQAESYLQHAEHYFRIVSAAQAQLPQGQQGFRSDGESDGDDDGEDERPMGGQNPYPHLRNDQPSFGASDPQPYVNGNGNGQGGERGDDQGDNSGGDGDDQPAVAEAQPQGESGEAAAAEGDQAPREGRFRSRRRRPYRDRDRAAGEGGAPPEGGAGGEGGE